MSTNVFALNFDDEIDKRIQLPPTTGLNNALGANHDLDSGLDELIDNSIDAGASIVHLVFHVEESNLAAITVHDDGAGMDEAKLQRVLRIGSHEQEQNSSIGIYGVGMKEGSFANTDNFIVISRVRGQNPTGFKIFKDSFSGGQLSERSVRRVWAIRDKIGEASRHGTSVVWDGITRAYSGNDSSQAEAFLSVTIADLATHFGIRYHRYIEPGAVTIRFHIARDGDAPEEMIGPEAIDPFGYGKSGHPGYPRTLTLGGNPDALGITVHIWKNRRDVPEFNLESKDDFGHQGFYFYIHNRLITQGGWFHQRRKTKSAKLLRIDISDPDVIAQYVTVSPQKGSVRLSRDFYRFIESLSEPGHPENTIHTAFDDAEAVLKQSNRRSGKPDPLAEPGSGIAPSIKYAIGEVATFDLRKPVAMRWGEIESGDFIEIDHASATITLNAEYREHFNPGRGRLNDAPLLKTLLYLVFSEMLRKDRYTTKARANTEMWISIINAAVEEHLDQL